MRIPSSTPHHIIKRELCASVCIVCLCAHFISLLFTFWILFWALSTKLFSLTTNVCTLWYRCWSMVWARAWTLNTYMCMQHAPSFIETYGTEKMTRKQVKFVLNCEREAWHKNAVTSTTSETKISTSIPLPPSPLQPLAVPLISLNQMKLSWRMAESKLLFITKWLIEMNVNWTRTHTKTHINELIMPYDTKNEYQREERESNTPVK